MLWSSGVSSRASKYSIVSHWASFALRLKLGLKHRNVRRRDHSQLSVCGNPHGKYLSYSDVPIKITKETKTLKSYEKVCTSL